MARLKRPDGVEIHWEQRGEGPLVVLAHSFFSHPEAFEALLEELASEHRVVTYHLRGCGESSRQGPYEVATDADDLAAVTEQAGAPAVVVALGDGCNRAVKAAAARPDLISAVVSPGGNPVGLEAAEGTDGLAASRSVVDALLQLLDTDYRAAMRTLLHTANPDMDEESLRERVNRTVAHSPHEAGAARMHDWVGDESAEEARAIGDRLWILEHGRNLWWSMEAARRTRELLPEAHIEEVSDGPLSRPDLTVAVVAELTSSPSVAQPSTPG